jgi:hypothetical protein
VRRVVALLGAQTFVFGLSESLLLISANAVFLGAYGSKWLPLTYVGIALVGTAASAAIARAVARRPLPRVALVTETAVALLFVGAWAVLAGAGDPWVSAPLLVLFPVLLQLGFVFVGGQAGRLLDVQQLKSSFPRIVSGFAAGFLVGGLVATPLLDLLGSTEHLLLIAAAAQVGFVVLLAATGSVFAERLRPVPQPAALGPRPPLRRLLATRFVALLIAYQVLSAAGTYLIEYLLFDRATARYGDAPDLARFLSKYTVVLNVVDMAFLAVAAGALLRRFGLRLGVAANPVVVTALAVAMLVPATTAEAGLALFVLVAAARIADVALTDGTTRTSLNTAFQLVPAEERLAAQAAVEGIGMPVAIGATGAVIFALRLLGASVAVIVGVTASTCLVWTASALMLYGDYGRALRHALQRRLLPEVGPEVGDDVAEALLGSNDARDVRLGLDLLGGAGVGAGEADLTRLAAEPRADVRVPALAALARSDPAVLARLQSEVDTLARAADAGERSVAAEAFAAEPGLDRSALPALVWDRDGGVRSAALRALGPGDADLLDDVLAALEEPATIEAAVDALARLGDAVLPAVAAALSEPVSPTTARLVRAARAAWPEGVARCLGPHVEHPDRELGLEIISALAAAHVDAEPLGPALDRALHADAEHAALCLAALAALEPAPLVSRALRDELALLRARVLALLAVAHGTRTVAPLALALDGADESRRSLGIELLEETLTRPEAALALPVIRPGLPDGERLRLLGASVPVPALDRSSALADLVEDTFDRWRSPWLQACALYELAETDARPAAPDDAVVRETLDWLAARALG